jgi:hypothetical protein
MYHWLHTLDKLGHNDAAVTANYPIYNVYAKGGVKTYVVYNYGTAPLVVTFSDGPKIKVGHGFATMTVGPGK